MTYTTIFGEEFENEFDEKMAHKYGDGYKCVKSVYPDVCKLPESEIQPMTYIARYKGDTVEEAKDFVSKYIKEKEPMWKQEYFNNGNEIGNTNISKLNLTPLTESNKAQRERAAKRLAPKKLIYPNEEQEDNKFLNRISPAYATFDTASLLYDRLKEMERFNTPGSDNYYHPVAFCQVGQKARKNPAYMPLAMGASATKEIYDLGKKTYKGTPTSEIFSDIHKDLLNNSEGFWHGFENPQNDCYEDFKFKLEEK